MKAICGAILIATASACSEPGAIGGGSAGQGGDGAAGGEAGTADPGGGRPGDAGAHNDGGTPSDGGAGPNLDAGAGGIRGTVEPSPIWNDSSALLQVSSGDFFNGYFGYERTRAQLSAAQLTELAQIRTAPALDRCYQDGLNIHFTITDEAGGVTQFRNDSCSASYQIVDPDAAEHFLKALPPCLLSKDERTAALATAPSVAIGDGCRNGLFTPSVVGTPDQVPPMWLRVTVPTANVPVLLELTDCGKRTFNLELLNEAGDTVLATGAIAGKSCQALSHRFDAPGSYVVRVTYTGGTSAGDFKFRAN